MRLLVHDERNIFSEQTRAYAEYRAFSGLIGSDEDVAHVLVTLRHRARDDARGDDPVVCTIAVARRSGGTEQVHAVARHAYAAIDRAVALIGRTSPLRRADIAE